MDASYHRHDINDKCERCLHHIICRDNRACGEKLLRIQTYYARLFTYKVLALRLA